MDHLQSMPLSSTQPPVKKSQLLGDGVLYGFQINITTSTCEVLQIYKRDIRSSLVYIGHSPELRRLVTTTVVVSY